MSMRMSVTGGLRLQTPRSTRGAAVRTSITGIRVRAPQRPTAALPTPRGPGFARATPRGARPGSVEPAVAAVPESPPRAITPATLPPASAVPPPSASADARRRGYHPDAHGPEDNDDNESHTNVHEEESEGEWCESEEECDECDMHEGEPGLALSDLPESIVRIDASLVTR